MLRRYLSGRAMAMGTAFLVLVSMAACGGPDESTAAAGSKKDVTFVLGGKVISWAPVYVADALGYFADEGLNTTVTVSQQGAPAAMAAVVGGDATVALTGLPAAVAPIRENAPLSLLFAAAKLDSTQYTASTAFLERTGVQPDAPLKERVQALKGATVGIYNPGDSTDQLTRFLLAKFGIDTDKDVRLVSLRTADAQYAALAAGNIDLMVVSPPWGAQAEAKGIGKIFLSAAEVPPLDNYPYLVGTVRTTSLEGAESAAVAGVVRAIGRALKTLNSAPDKARPVLRKEFADLDDASFDISFDEMLGQLPESPDISEDLWKSAVSYAEAQNSPITESYADIVAHDFVLSALAEK